MKIYIDSDYKCHTSNPDGTYREFEVKFFNNKCQKFIEGYLYIPQNEQWTRSDGEVFTGEMVAPWKTYDELDASQREYEREKLSEQAAELEDMRNALNTLGVTLDE